LQESEAANLDSASRPRLAKINHSMQRNTVHPYRGVLALNQNYAVVISGYSPKSSDVVCHRRKVRSLKAGQQDLHIATDFVFFLSITPQVGISTGLR